jgi:hypothetical protein
VCVYLPSAAFPRLNQRFSLFSPLFFLYQCIISLQFRVHLLQAFFFELLQVCPEGRHLLLVALRELRLHSLHEMLFFPSKAMLLLFNFGLGGALKGLVNNL